MTDVSVQALSPGVRFEFRDAATGRTPWFRTDIAGMVGFAERGPLHRPVLVESWQQYTTVFGGLSDLGYLSYAVRLFFDNGGRSVYVVRVAVPITDDDFPVTHRAAAASSALMLRDSHGTLRPIRIVATSVGRWGNGLQVDVLPERRGRATLRIRVARTTSRIAGVSLDPADERFLWNVLPHGVLDEAPPVLRGDATATQVPLALETGPPDDLPENLDFVTLAAVQLRGGRDGVSAVTTRHMIGEIDSENRRYGLAALFDLDQVSIVAMPDGSAFPLREAEYAPLRTKCDPEYDEEAPPGTIYVVAKETRLTVLATKLGTTSAELRKWNPHLDTDLVPGGTEIGIPVVTSDVFPDVVQPLFAGSLLPIAERLAVNELARRLGAAPDGLRVANPGLGEFVDPGDTVSVPLAPGSRSANVDRGAASRRASPSADHLTPGRNETISWLNSVASRSGLSRSELLRANPAYRLATRTQPWRAPGTPIRVPAPPAEHPPQWDDAASTAFTRALISFCERRRDCVTLIDAPGTVVRPEDAVNYRNDFRSSFAAMYWPWLQVRFSVSDAATGRSRVERIRQLNMPASGAVAGALAAADREAGPHRSPAGRRMQSAVATAYPLDDEEHGDLNRQGVNAFRERPGRGVVLEGTRSMSRDRALRYFNVRRTLLAILEVLDERSQWAVFEPNGPRLWLDLGDRITAALTHLWNRGWLLGNVPSRGFTVTCDETTNPPIERDLGQVIAHISLRIPPPIEWIQVRIGQSASGVQILDVEAA